jgi:Fur family peroxide stress response transcriptional regulator
VRSLVTMNRERQIALFKEQCQANGIKLTPQRLLIYEELINSIEHPSAERIYNSLQQKFPTISLDTVHRTLDTFCAIGVAAMVEGTGSPKRFEGNLDDHHHARCIKCGKIQDFYHAEYDRLPVPHELAEDFQVFRKTVHLEGICRTCRQKGGDMMGGRRLRRSQHSKRR